MSKSSKPLLLSKKRARGGAGGGTQARHLSAQPRRGTTTTAEHYEVEAIVNERGTGAELEYLVKWVGFAKPTWQPQSDCDGCPTIVAAWRKAKAASQSHTTTAPRGNARRKRAATHIAIAGEDDDEAADEASSVVGAVGGAPAAAALVAAASTAAAPAAAAAAAAGQNTDDKGAADFATLVHVVSHRQDARGAPEYLLEWSGARAGERSWVRADQCTHPDAISDYERRMRADPFVIVGACEPGEPGELLLACMYEGDTLRWHPHDVVARMHPQELICYYRARVKIVDASIVRPLLEARKPK